MSNNPCAIEQVREVTPEVLDGLVSLLAQLSSSAHLDSERLKAVIDNPNTFLLIARTERHDVVGTTSLAIFSIPTGTRAWIEDVVVDEKHRGQGIASALVNAALDIAHERGARTVDLTSRPSRQEANLLYEKHGFVRRETNVWRYNFTDGT
jgi:ribosomal protein S18 acetylase RimI-like enzyme